MGKKIREKGRGELYKKRRKCILESTIEFPDPELVTLKTPHGSNPKFLKKCTKNVIKMRGEKKLVFTTNS